MRPRFLSLIIVKDKRIIDRSKNQHFQLHFLSLLVYTSRVTHVATQGLNDPPKEVNGSNINSWVKEYSLEYSSDGKTYNGYYFDKDLKVR